MALLRVTKEEGHYTIKRVDRLPKRGNYNILYAMKTKTLNKFYRYLQDGEYEEIYLGAVSINNTSDLVNDGSDGTSVYVENNDLSEVAISGDYNDLINTPVVANQDLESVLTEGNDAVGIDITGVGNLVPSGTLNSLGNNDDYYNVGYFGNLRIKDSTANNRDYFIGRDGLDLAFRFENTPDSNTFTTLYNLNSTGTPENDTDLVTLGYFNDNVTTGIESVVAGTNVTIDDTDPLNPIINASGGGGGGGLDSIVAGDNISVDNSDPDNPEVSADGTDLVYNSSNRTMYSSTGNSTVIPYASSSAGLIRFLRAPLSIQSITGTLAAGSHTISMYTIGVAADDYKQVNGILSTVNGTVPSSSFSIVINFSGGLFTNTTTFSAGAGAGAVQYTGITGDFHSMVVRALGSAQLAFSAIDASTGGAYDFSNATFTNAVIRFSLCV